MVSPVELTTSEGITNCWLVVPGQVSLNAAFSEWYAVTNDVTLTARLNVAGNVKLHLCEGATLTCEQGIRVADGNGLTIEGEGAMVAKGEGDYSAAIGSD